MTSYTAEYHYMVTVEADNPEEARELAEAKWAEHNGEWAGGVLYDEDADEETMRL